MFFEPVSTTLRHLLEPDPKPHCYTAAIHTSETCGTCSICEFLVDDIINTDDDVRPEWIRLLKIIMHIANYRSLSNNIRKGPAYSEQLLCMMHLAQVEKYIDDPDDNRWDDA